ncbi:MAG: VWA domain-containing protein, partial [Campylobacterota bacterium]|nr:VWA domain-containing protein [Campylobacterota bacterium]
MKHFFMSIVLVFATLFTGALAEDNPRAVIIFDASGSMWGQINGVTKIEIARDALKNVIKEWNPNVELGLTVYGHRTKGDCNDIETVIPVSKVDKKQVVSTVMDIKPKGKTPISRSLRKVAEEIKYTEEKATIILISDGKETCDPDPCGTAKELEAQGIDFVTHVIGFNVDKKTDKQLECIANATGGEYFSAKNAAALNEAMKVIVQKVEVVEPKPEPKPVVKKLKNNLEASASEEEGGKWVKAYHRVYKSENGQKSGDQLTSVNSTKKDAGVTKLPIGHYVLQSEYNEFKKQTPFEVKEGEVTKVHAVMGQTGNVGISVSEKEGGKWVRSYVYIYP